MCVGAQTPRSLLVPKRASVCAAERERRGRAYETLAMSPPSSKIQEEACAAAAREHLLLGQVWRRGNRALGGRAHPVRPRRTAAPHDGGHRRPPPRNRAAHITKE